MKSKDIFDTIMKTFKFRSKKGESEEIDIEKIAAREQKQFSYESLAKATDKFHPNRKLGEGGFGPVYKGKLEDGREVAVKMLSQFSRQGKKEFRNEAKLLARVQHRNVVNLLGYCAHGGEKLLVYEYVPNESLDKILFNPCKKEQLDWKRRYDIIAGVAKGLLYLHEDSHTCIIHRDIKASNILLDENWVPKIADFGMARLFPEDQTHVYTRIAGTNGYMSPEYVMRGHLSIKADVFSFGVLMLELISGQRNSSINLAIDADNLLEWAYKLYKKRKSLEFMDPTLQPTADPEQVSFCVHIGLLCTQSDPDLRPIMRRVVVLLSKKPSTLEEPTRPGYQGTRHPTPKQRGVSSSGAGSSGTYSSSRFGSTTNSATVTATASNPISPRSDLRGKRPAEDQ
ncbi:Cysteine-rich receptor-like protein kinase 43 [Ancistrocladus abbreviatus]